MAKKIFPQLDFDSSGSASVRFFGLVTELGIHYANAKVPMIRMICPKTIDTTNDCKVCTSGSLPSSRNLAIGWDCRMNRWALYLGTTGTFSEIFKQCKAAGVTGQMMSDGLGPDIILQRIGSHTEVVIATETIGRQRGEVRIDDPIKIINDLAKESYYVKFDTIAEIEAAYPKDIPSRAISYSGEGFSGSFGVSGVSGVSYIGERLELVREADVQSKRRKLKTSVEPDAVKAKPKIKETNVKPEVPRTNNDRWDLLG